MKPRKNDDPKPSQVLDDNDLAPENQDLDFEEEAVPLRAGDEAPSAEPNQSPERAREAGLTGGAFPGEGPTTDDVTPDTLINDDGARTPQEAGASGAADEQLTETTAKRIGAGRGLDEAELGRVKPLDGKPWDGDPDEPLGTD